MSDDITIRDIVQTFKQNIDGAQIVKINDPRQLNFILSRAISEVFYVGHGHEEGVNVGYREISWNELSHYVDLSRSELHYFAMCYSGNIKTQKPVMTFTGTTEADLTALTILAHHHWRHGNYQKYIHFSKELYTTIQYKKENPSKIRFLDDCHPTYWWVAKYRDIWFDTWNEYPIYAKYEHPDRTVYNINPGSEDHIEGNDFIAGHMSVYMIADLMETIDSMLVAADWCEILSRIFTVAEVPLATIFEILEWMLTVAAVALFDWVNDYVIDETGTCGWAFFKDGVLHHPWPWSWYYTWYQKVGSWMWCYVYQPVVIGPGDWPIPWITPLSTGWNFIDDIPLEIPDPDPDPPPGGGCPILAVYDGNTFQTEGLLDIHNPDGFDVIYSHTLENTPSKINQFYLLRLTEHPQTISHIDRVQLLGRLTEGIVVQLPLFSAIHSTQGQVRWKLWLGDARRVDLHGADHNDGISEEIYLIFFAPPHLSIVEFVFVIEGNNPIVK
ncbi:MAG: hypothetical protein Q6364_00010 [Candidatus Hermodarchaeota archaeon]|nr:hypothetical protein [Candidatus Hermodarchaeota archaeon]